MLDFADTTIKPKQQYPQPTPITMNNYIRLPIDFTHTNKYKLIAEPEDENHNEADEIPVPNDGCP